MATATITNPPTPPEGFSVYRSVYQDGWISGQAPGKYAKRFCTTYLFGRTSSCGCHETKAHGVFLSDDGSKMRTYCGRDLGWLHDNWREELDRLPEDLCQACAKVIRKANPR